MDTLEIISVPVITAIVYMVIEAYKYAVQEKEKAMRFIPLIAVGLGCILGVTAFYAVKSMMPAGNVLSALLVGGASGLAATGTHQLFKQLSIKNSSALSSKTNNAAADEKTEQTQQDAKKDDGKDGNNGG